MENLKRKPNPCNECGIEMGSTPSLGWGLCDDCYDGEMEVQDTVRRNTMSDFERSEAQAEYSERGRWS